MKLYKYTLCDYFKENIRVEILKLEVKETEKLYIDEKYHCRILKENLNKLSGYNDNVMYSLNENLDLFKKLVNEKYDNEIKDLEQKLNHRKERKNNFNNKIKIIRE